MLVILVIDNMVSRQNGTTPMEKWLYYCGLLMYKVHNKRQWK